MRAPSAVGNRRRPSRSTPGGPGSTSAKARPGGALAQAEDGGADDGEQGPLALDGAERGVGVDEAGEHAVGGVGEADGGVAQAGVGEQLEGAPLGARAGDLRGGDDREGDDEDVAGVERGASDAGELATGAVKDDEGGVGVLAGGGGVDLEAQLGGVAEQLGDRSGAQVGDGDRGEVDRLDQPRAGGRLRERLGVERGVGAVRAEARGVELDAAGEQAQGGDLVVLRVEELAADGVGDRPRGGLGVLVEERGDDDDAQGGAQPGAQGGDGVQDLAAVDLRGEDRCGVLTAEQGARVGAKAQPQLGEAVVADDAGVVGGLAQAVAADHAAERGAGDQLVLDGLDEDAAGEQVELGLAADRARRPMVP
jgi:hypothetical protein